MLRIIFKNGNVCEYRSNQFTDYEWKRAAFVVIKGNQWIAMFNWDCIESVFYIDE